MLHPNLVGVFNGPLPERKPHQAYAVFNRVDWPYPDPAVSLFKIGARTPADAYLPQLAESLVLLLGEKLTPRGLPTPIRVDHEWEYVPYGHARYLLQKYRVAIFEMPYWSTWWLDVIFSGTLLLIPGCRDPQRKLFPHLPVYLKSEANPALITAQLLASNSLDRLILEQQKHLSWKLRRILDYGYNAIG